MPGAVLSPYALIGLVQGGTAGNNNLAQASQYVTMGNKSSPSVENTAALKSLQINVAKGIEVVAEVIDEEGGEFTAFANLVDANINTTFFSIIVDFGWLINYCGAGGVVPYFLSTLPPPFNGRVYVVLNDLEVAYTNGRMKYTIKGTNPFEANASFRVNFPFGSDDQQMRLVPAIQKLAARSGASSPRVLFSRMNNGTNIPFGFNQSEGGTNGPYSAWAANQQQPLAAARKWLNSLTTDRGKGTVAILNSMEPVPTLTFVEDPMPACDENPQENQYFGTYIYGGGACSPVISFEPKTNYMPGLNINPGAAAVGLGA